MPRLLNLGARFSSIALTIYTVYIVFYPLPPLQERAIFVLILMLVLFFRESMKRSRANWAAGYLAVCFIVVIVFGYIAFFHESVEERAGIPSTAEIILGIVAIIIVLDATRRVAGLAFLAFIVAFLFYGILGYVIPMKFGGHAGFGIDRIVNTIYLTTNGMFGIVLYVMYKYLFLFVLFGRVLEETGALDFIMDLSRSLVGHIKGGPAMVSTVSSGLVGSISGSAVANVTITGSVSIPMMKRMGFEPHVAGAVEASASTGGQFMPPVMGTVAFLIMQFLGIPYVAVMQAAVVPATIYFVALGMAVYVYAHRCGLQGLPRSELPRLKDVLPSVNALTFIAGLGALLTFLLRRYSPTYAALWAIVVMSALSLIGKDRITPRKVFRVLETTPVTFLSVGVAGVGIGIMVGVIMLTGLALRFSSLILGLAGGSLMLTMVLTMATSIILGTGLPTPVTYTLLAILVAPALIKLGILPLAAHMFIFFSGMMSMVTPPVALSAYAGASLAGANMWRTAVTACMLSIPAYILPYVFILDNSLMLMGSPLQTAWAIFRSLVGCALLAYAIVGPARNRKEIAQRVAFVAGAILLIIPQYWADVVALMVILIAFLPQVLQLWLKRNARAPTER